MGSPSGYLGSVLRVVGPSQAVVAVFRPPGLERILAPFGTGLTAGKGWMDARLGSVHGQGFFTPLIRKCLSRVAEGLSYTYTYTYTYSYSCTPDMFDYVYPSTGSGY